MSSSNLPRYVDPRQYAGDAVPLSGRYALADLRRIVAASVASDGEVGFSLNFRKEGARWFAEGRVEAILSIACQRCLEPYRLVVDREVRLAFVSDADEASRVPDAYDPWILDDGRVLLSDLIEDELLLAIPDIPRHPDGTCVAPASSDGGVQAPHGPVAEAAANPFAMLASLKKASDPENSKENAD